MRKVNYRKIYGNDIPKGWHIHHIDFDRNNNIKENLIAIPPILHKLIHHFFEPATIDSAILLDRRTVESLLDIYNQNIKQGDEQTESAISKRIEEFMEQDYRKVPDAKYKRLCKKWTNDEILSGRYLYPKGKVGDAIYEHIYNS